MHIYLYFIKYIIYVMMTMTSLATMAGRGQASEQGGIDAPTQVVASTVWTVVE
jgi:hypothetical protein